MFDRFTDHARKAMAFARQEAERFHHSYIGSEHILLGVVKVGECLAVIVLENSGVTLDAIRFEVEKHLKPGAEATTLVQLPFTPGGKKVLEIAIHEARALGHDYVGTEHLLLGFMHEKKSIAAQALDVLGLKPEAVRSKLLEFLGANVQATTRFNEESAPLQPVLGFELYAHKAMRCARNEAHAEGSNTVLSEHLLLGLLSVPDCLAAKLLTKHGLELDSVRAEIVKLRAESGDSN